MLCLLGGVLQAQKGASPRCRGTSLGFCFLFYSRGGEGGWDRGTTLTSKSCSFNCRERAMSEVKIQKRVEVKAQEASCSISQPRTPGHLGGGQVAPSLEGHPLTFLSSLPKNPDTHLLSVCIYKLRLKVPASQSCET